MFPRPLILLTLVSSLLAPLQAEENAWPFFVRRTDPRIPAESAQYLGPLIFVNKGAGVEKGFRPLYLSATVGDAHEGTFLYPFFTWRSQEGFRAFSFFQLVNFRSHADDAAEPDDHFDIWPIYFSRDSDDPDESYRAVFPVGGTIKNRFGKDRIRFVVFPLYSRTEKAGKRIVHAPWPFLRFIGGDSGHHGFEFWPLFGKSAREGDYRRQFYVWPLGYKAETKLSEPVPDVKLGVLPFYARDTGAGYISETYAWPFFGYTDRTAPYRYHEARYFWPLFVQARGDDRYVNRWAPFYTHSTIKGTDKTWYAWPIYRDLRWEADGIAQQKQQVLFFLYWSLEQNSLTNPAAAPAYKKHLWPLYSAWDNGAGQKQVQALSPFEVFFPNNAKVRQLWTPLFALYRYDRKPEATRHSLLWNAVTWRRSPTEKEFHAGPLLSVNREADRGRIAIAKGLLGWRRSPEQPRWKFFLFDFRMKPATSAAPAASP